MLWDLFLFIYERQYTEQFTDNQQEQKSVNLTELKHSEELRQFLLYFEQTTDEHAVNDTLLRIHEMIKAVKHSEEVQDKYMKTWEWEDKIRAEGREEGQREKRIHTQQERDRAEQEIVRLRKELEQLKKQLS